ncbi:soil-associated protein, TIGR03435 family [Arachidicoccus rhizosphaerae]|uniref:Soil-associated protein, TIGR03435 family n=1 Tax=Arachidicoccus rhizosphaerae TaxID=551991 RepID=A0A1H4A6P6_9BACT|nr:redoxin family protein [Arachidicoccus rhizosphaerae]SEA31803.1 soil-associated protein, TIGR03435 family [Arachidicoccus rhizosphaerae]
MKKNIPFWENPLIALKLFLFKLVSLLFPKWSLLILMISIAAVNAYSQKVDTANLSHPSTIKMERQTLLSIGDTIPDQSFAIIPKNSKTVSPVDLKLNSLKGKVIIIDFWATWCGPCLPALQHLNQLQQKIGKDKLVTIAISMDSNEDILRTIKHVDVSDIHFSSDSNFMKQFKFHIIPHTIVINKEGVIVGITYPDSITVQKIQEVIATNHTVFPLKKDNQQKNNAIEKVKELYSVRLATYDSTNATGIYKDSTKEGVELKFVNFTIPSLFREVFRMPAQTWVVNNTGDSTLGDYTVQNMYCLTVHLPYFESYSKAYKIAQQALNASFKFKGKLIKQQQNVYALKYKSASGKMNISADNSRDSSITFYGPNLIASNITTKSLVDYLSNELGYLKNMIVLDETALSKKFDITLKWEYAHLPSLVDELKKYGFYLEQKHEFVHLLSIEYP